MSGRYLTRSRLLGLAESLSPRDQAILQTLATVRLATGDQLTRLHLADLTPRRARVVLSHLTDEGVLLRLPRRVGGVRAGSAGLTYGLTAGGWRLAGAAPGRRGVDSGVGMMFVRHALVVTEVFVRLHEADRAGMLGLTSYQGEPQCWRTFAGPGGGRVILKPDALVTVRVDGYEDRWALEIDMATESTSAIRRACEKYWSYRQTGREQALGHTFPRVLWLVPDAHRYEEIVAVLGTLPPAHWKLHAVALQADVIERIARGVMA